MYLLCSRLRGGHVQKDFTKFANQRFLRTVNWEVLGKLLTKHRAGLKNLDLDTLLADEAEGRKRITEYLLGSKDSYPDGLIQDLHRIVRLDSPTGMRLLQEEAERQGVVIIDPAESPTATPRDYALVGPGATANVDVSVPGARRGDFADPSLDTSSIAFVLDCHVWSNSSVRVTAGNVSASTVDLAAAALALHVVKRRLP